MGSFKISFVTCLTILSFQIGAIHSRSLKDEEKINEINDQIEDSDRSSDARQCICFPYTNSGVPVTNYMTPETKGEQERLVVYFYKKRDSDKLTIFMPSQQKQLLLPDLTYDEGDRLETIVPEQLVDLFHKNMGYFTKIPQAIDSTIPDKELISFGNITYGTYLDNPNVPINSNQENNEKIVFFENTNQYPLSGFATTEDASAFTNSPYIDDNVIPSNNQNKIINLTPGNDQWHVQNTKTTQKSNQSLDGQNKRLQATDNLPDNNSNALLSPKDPESGVLTSNIKYNNVFSTQPNKLPLGDVATKQIGAQHTPVVYKDLNGFPKLTGSDIGSLKKPKSRPKVPSHLLPDTNSKFFPSLESQNQSINNMPIELEKEYVPAYQAQNSAGSTDFTKYIGPLPSYELVDKNPNLIDMSYPNAGNNINSIKYLPNKYDHPLFDNWFIKQIKILSLKRPSISKVNLRSLKLLLMKALHENGIYMSENGELYDMYGNIFEMTNIKLRPILLGNPIDYEKIVASNNCVIPHDIAYLEAVLVSFGNPPKILALIPLRRIFVTKSHDNVFGYNNIHSDNTRCGSHGCAQSKSDEPASQFSDQTYNEDYDETSGLIESRSDGIDKESNVLEASHNDIKDSLDTRLKFEYQNLLPPLSPSFRNMYGEGIDKKVGDKEIKGKSEEYFDVPHPISDKPDEEDDDSLGIRIIGGNPATSSGTPITSKGRSGLNMSIL